MYTKHYFIILIIILIPIIILISIIIIIIIFIIVIIIIITLELTSGRKRIYDNDLGLKVVLPISFFKPSYFYNQCVNFFSAHQALSHFSSYTCHLYMNKKLISEIYVDEITIKISVVGEFCVFFLLC